MTSVEPIVCKNCGATGTGRHCPVCGQKLKVERITLHSILHEWRTTLRTLIKDLATH